MPTKLLLFTDSLYPSGMGTMMSTLLEQLDPQRYSPHLVLPRELRGSALHTKARSQGVATRLLTVRDAGDDFDSLVEYCRTTQIDLIHVHAGVGWEGNWGTWAGCKLGIPSLRTEHLPFLLTDPGNRLEHMFVTNKVAQIIAVSDSARQTFLQNGVAAHKVTTIANGIKPPPQPSLAAVADLRHRLGLPATAPLFVSVGRLDDQKGYDTLLFAVPQILAACPDARFVIVGEGPHHLQLQRLIDGLAISHAVRLFGHSNEVPALLRAAFALLMPSRFEGLPLVGLEALALGTPIIGTAVVGLTDLVEHGVTGLLTPPADVQGLAHAVVHLLVEPGLQASLARHGPAIFRQRYLATRMVSETMQLYDAILMTSDVARRPYATPVEWMESTPLPFT